jgi:hypothetical protein
MSAALILGLAILALAIVIIVRQRSGPRVTEINRVIRKNKDSDDA